MYVHYLIFLTPCLSKFGGYLEHKKPCGRSLCGINIARDMDLKLWNGEGNLKLGSLCLKLEITLIKRFGGSVSVVMYLV